MKRVYAIGELLVDFVCTDVDTDLEHGVNYVRKPGGAPANVCAVICTLGGTASFIGCVGDDPFGRYLLTSLQEFGVNTSLCRRDRGKATTLAFVSLMSGGERDFTFSRGADAHLELDDVRKIRFGADSVVHFGSATAYLGGGLLEAYTFALHTAYESGALICLDPNYRAGLWHRKKREFVSHIRKHLPMADIVKVSEEELYLVSGTESMDSGLKELHHAGARHVAVTRSSRGVLYSTQDYRLEVPSIPVEAVDSTGAGDAFVGAMLHFLSKAESIRHTLSDPVCMRSVLEFANTVAALVCTKHGAMSAIPSRDEVYERLNG
ncbi:MAG: carbohydrate kinase family protein [Spirochaetota bacterium]